MASIKVATYNINKDEGKFPQRIYDLSTQIRDKKLDIICFQEDYHNKKFSSSKFLNIELDFHYITTTTRQKERNNINSTSNLTILSRYKTVLLEEVYLNRNKKNESAFQIVEVELKKEKILLINTHMFSADKKTRTNKLNKILEYTKKYDSFYNMILICGDLNTNPNSDEINYLKSKGFNDNNTNISHTNGIIVDYILYKTTYEDLYVHTKTILKNFSDHYCLVNKFNF